MLSELSHIEESNHSFTKINNLNDFRKFVFKYNNKVALEKLIKYSILETCIQEEKENLIYQSEEEACKSLNVELFVNDNRFTKCSSHLPKNLFKNKILKNLKINKHFLSNMSISL